MATTMGTMLILAITCALAAESLSCLDAGMERFYSELKCQPVKPEGSNCPSHYDCQNLRDMDKTKCHYKDSSYDHGDIISSDEIDDPCIPRCNCASKDSRGFNFTQFSCIHADCPELLPRPLDPGCYHQYKTDTCCSTGVHCVPPTKSDEADLKCTYEGREYFKGQRIDLPRSTCKSCICDEGFDGTLDGPWCRNVSCGIHLRQSLKTILTCAPVFYGKDSCCPIASRCPEKGDRIIRKNKSKETDQQRCTFGSLRLNKGDLLSMRHPSVKCVCQTPPLVTCIQTPDSKRTTNGRG